MKIDIPFEIGDPVIVINESQHDGYYLSYRAFDYHYIPLLGTRVFGKAKDANEALEQLNRK